MTIWRHWCKGCGDRVGAGAGYCQAEECRGLRQAVIDRDLPGRGTRAELLQELDGVLKDNAGAKESERYRNFERLRGAVADERHDAVPKYRWEAFECMKRGSPTYAGVDLGVAPKPVPPKVVPCRQVEVNGVPLTQYERDSADERRVRSREKAARLLQSGNFTNSVIDGGYKEELDGIGDVLGRKRQPGESDKSFRVVLLDRFYFYRDRPVSPEANAGIEHHGRKASVPNRGARIGNHPGFSNADTIPVATQFASSSGSHLDKVANINGVMRCPGESDDGLRARLSKMLVGRGC